MCARLWSGALPFFQDFTREACLQKHGHSEKRQNLPLVIKVMKHVGTRGFRLNCCVCVDSDVPSKQRTLFGGKAACRKGQQQSAFSGCDRNQTVNHLSCKPIFGPFNQQILEAPSKMHIISSLDTETQHSKTVQILVYIITNWLKWLSFQQKELSCGFHVFFKQLYGWGLWLVAFMFLFHWSGVI